jgi:hypothetical protein
MEMPDVETSKFALLIRYATFNVLALLLLGSIVTRRDNSRALQRRFSSCVPRN